jgi:hypothetical protein
MQAVDSAAQQSTEALQQKLAAGIKQASSGAADSINRVEQLVAQQAAHTSSMADGLESQTKVREICPGALMRSEGDGLHTRSCSGHACCVCRRVTGQHHSWTNMGVEVRSEHCCALLQPKYLTCACYCA